MATYSVIFRREINAYKSNGLKDVVPSRSPGIDRILFINDAGSAFGLALTAAKSNS